ncbi:unnamed protein product [Closterium sp. Yama58-4]|nr:unnamed protein product [Closterium sp. Yama58-4]
MKQEWAWRLTSTPTLHLRVLFSRSPWPDPSLPPILLFSVSLSPLSLFIRSKSTRQGDRATESEGLLVKEKGSEGMRERVEGGCCGGSVVMRSHEGVAECGEEREKGEKAEEQRVAGGSCGGSVVARLHEGVEELAECAEEVEREERGAGKENTIPPQTSSYVDPSNSSDSPQTTPAVERDFVHKVYDANAGDGSSSSDLNIPAVERDFVHKVYDAIAPHFSATRFARWPKVAEFLLSLPAGSLVLDAGCGNGKYLNGGLPIPPALPPALPPAASVSASSSLSACASSSAFPSSSSTPSSSTSSPPSSSPSSAAPPRPPAVLIGCDISPSLVSICTQRGFEAFVADTLSLPLASSRFDAAISVAVLHHLSSESRRKHALREMLRVVRRGGRVLVTVWAREQENPGLLDKWTPLIGQMADRRGLEGKVIPGEEGATAAGEGVSEQSAAGGRGEKNLIPEQEKGGAGEARAGGESVQGKVTGMEASQEFLVPWHLPCHRVEIGSAAAAQHVASGFARRDEAKGSVVYNRYYYVFTRGSSQRLVVHQLLRAFTTSPIGVQGSDSLDLPNSDSVSWLRRYLSCWSAYSTAGLKSHSALRQSLEAGQIPALHEYLFYRATSNVAWPAMLLAATQHHLPPVSDSSFQAVLPLIFTAAALTALSADSLLVTRGKLAKSASLSAAQLFDGETNLLLQNSLAVAFAAVASRIELEAEELTEVDERAALLGFVRVAKSAVHGVMAWYGCAWRFRAQPATKTATADADTGSDDKEDKITVEGCGVELINDVPQWLMDEIETAAADFAALH